jgi:putative aldouronate transport system substrate-binding protein
MELQTHQSSNFATMGHTPFAKGLTERTGIEAEYLHPPTGGAREAFNLMVADGNFPDIIEWNFASNYPGGPQKAIDDGVIIPLNDIIEKYCPNLKKVLDDHPDWAKQARTDSGQYYVFPFFRDGERLQFSGGLIVRQDWLRELGLQNPGTIDEVHDLLVAFRDRKGSKAPYTAEGGGLGSFAMAYGLEEAFYIGDDGKMRHGILEPGYRQFIQTMAQWYKEGLLDPDLFTQNFQTVSAKMTSGASGMSAGSVNSRMTTWNNAAKKTAPNFSLKMVPQVTLVKGARPEYASGDLPFAPACLSGISTDCKNIEWAARLQDYGYSDEGHMYYNFGTPGVSYNMVNGFPTYTDLIVNNPNGWPTSQALGAYARAGIGGAMAQDVRYIDQYMNNQEGKETLDVIQAPWVLKHKRPTLTPTQAESQELARIMNEVNTYITEMKTKFILGTEPLSSYDTFIATVRRMGIERAIEIENAALTRYNKR